MPISYKHKIYTTLGTPTDLSGDVVSATDSAGVPAKDYTVKGETIVWNQLLDKSKYPATTTSSGVTFTNNGDGTITVNGTAGSTVNAYFNVDKNISVIQGHKYYATMSKPIEHANFWLGLYANSGDAPFPGGTILDRNGKIVDCVRSSDVSYSIHLYKNASVSNAMVKPQLFDLTQMFGAGNEPATVAEFRAMFPDDYYPYNAGELKTIVPMSVEASGVERFQLLDKSKYPATTTRNGVTFTNNGDGTITVNGTGGLNGVYHNFVPPAVKSGHKYMLYGCPTGGSNNMYCIVNTIYKSGRYSGSFSDLGSGAISRALEEGEMVTSNIFIAEGYTANNLVFKPQLFDLTQMFGAGNEPATPAEFWQKVPEKLYSYNPNDYKSVNIPSSKYFPDGMRSAGSAYDEINFLSQKAIKRVGVRPYQAGDENNTSFITDKKNTVYALSTPVETAIAPPLQVLSTFKGFTSFSAPNSLTQNGPLSVTYYAEGGASPEKGWLTSYKRKLYMGRNIEWNQLVNYNNFQNQVITNGITFVSNGDGLIVANGTCTGDGASYNIIPWTAVNPASKFLICGCPQGGSEFTYKIWDTNYQSYKDFGEGCVTGDMEAYSIWINIKSGTTVRDLVFKPQFFNLTKMFGAGNEPSTPEEFWSYFDHKLYPYNAGETRPLFKISRKSYIYKEPAGYTVYFADWVWIADTVTISVEYADGSTETLTSQNDMGGKSRSNVVKMTFTDTNSDRYVRYKMPANGGSEESLYMMPTVTLVLTADAEIVEIGK